jgi:hypothetical protein
LLRAPGFLLRAVTAAACALLAAATVVRLYRGGSPYFTRSATIVDHLGPREHEAHREILALQRAAKTIPRGARVSVVPDDTPHYLTAIALLPDHVVVHGRGDYVIDVR